MNRHCISWHWIKTKELDPGKLTCWKGSSYSWQAKVEQTQGPTVILCKRWANNPVSLSLCWRKSECKQENQKYFRLEATWLQCYSTGPDQVKSLKGTVFNSKGWEWPKPCKLAIWPKSCSQKSQVTIIKTMHTLGTFVVQWNTAVVGAWKMGGFSDTSQIGCLWHSPAGSEYSLILSIS